MVPGFVPIVEAEYVGVYEVMHDFDLVEHFFSPGLFDGLNSHVFDGFLFPSLVDDAEFSSSNFFIYVIIVHII